ncbi:HNH endonuclease signature motif containing protein [Rhizorhabdus histidinilytica]|uniref:HNH endonuclease signature motif containing protein n=1 Tax=Rhizorhabdus histidinilytica TaxID=439228 RepID=UPI0009A66B05
MIDQKSQERFFSKFDATKPTECWLWRGCLTKDGYGRFPINQRHIRAHRLSWALANGRNIPEGMVVCHSCDVRHCVNPSHLWLGTPAANTADMIAKGRQPRKYGPTSGPLWFRDAIAKIEAGLPAFNRLGGRIKTHCRAGHRRSFETCTPHAVPGAQSILCKVCKLSSLRKARANLKHGTAS